VSLRQIYIVASTAAEVIEVEGLAEALRGDDVALEKLSSVHWLVTAGEVKIEIQFDARTEPIGWSPELVTGPSELKRTLEKARGFYSFQFQPGSPQPSVAVFEALWTIRALLELTEGVVLDVTSFKLHNQHDIAEITELDFDIRDHVTLHSLEMGTGGGVDREGAKLWVHSHGMSKFGAPDAEIFQLEEEDLPASERFLHELCTDLAFGQGPKLRSVTSTSSGQGFVLLPFDEGRANLFSVGRVPSPMTAPNIESITRETGSETLWSDHQGNIMTVVGTDHRHSLSEILGPYRERFEGESEVEAAALQQFVRTYLGTFKSRFLRRGLMEPLAFLVRAPFEVHPGGDDDITEEERLWVEVVQWDESELIGKLVDGGQTTSEWRKGAHVEIDEAQINAIAVNRDGKMLDPDEMKRLLKFELPA
jgi:hypothetical protein